MLGVFIAIISGALMSLQGIFNAGVTKQTSIWVSASFVQFSALIVCIAAWAATGFESSFSALLHIDGKYMLLGGVMGAAITYTVIRGMDALGPAQAVMIIVVSQLLVAYLVELFGAFGVDKAGFEMKKLLGLGLCVAGILLFKWQSK